MLELLGALVAGLLTPLAPCALTLLPVIVGGSVAGQATVSNDEGAEGSVATALAVRSATRRRAVIVTASLGISVIVFTLILRASAALIGIPTEVWQWLSGGLLIGLGVVGLFPHLWDSFAGRLGLGSRSNAALRSAYGREGTAGAVLTGAALGPVFTSCSPLYGYVVVTVIPAEPAKGLVLLLVYTAGLCAVLLAVALLGQRLIRRLRWAADPESPLRRIIAMVFIVLGVLIATGTIKDLETWLVENSPIRPWDLEVDVTLSQ